MRRRKLWTIGAVAALGAGLALSACDNKAGDTKKGATATSPTAGAEAKPDIKVDKGVDLEAKKIKVAALVDLSGPAATIGKPFALGKKIAFAQANDPASKLLPEGWTIERIEKDHGYNPTKSLQSYKEIKDEVLFVETSFGTPNTLPLRPMLKQDHIYAFPASLSSQMAENEFTPPLGASYMVEAMRAMDWVVASAGGADKVKAGIVWQKDDYGQDGLNGWKKAAEKLGVTVVAEPTVSPAQKDFAAVVTALKDAGATHVMLSVLPSASGPILGQAAQLKYMPVWIGQTPAWIDNFFDVIPAAALTNFHWVHGFPYWGEDVPGMKPFQEAFAKYGDGAKPNHYVLLSYLQGLAQVEAIKRAIEGKDLTRAGFGKALHAMDKFDAGGMIKPLDMSKVPYVVSTETRIFKPDHAKKSWAVVADYATPSAPAAAK